MNTEFQHIWQEVLADISTPAALWQLLIIVSAVAIAWAINGALRSYLIRHSQTDEIQTSNIKMAQGGVSRILFPVTAFLIVVLARFVFAEWLHVSMLQVASRLLLAMAVVRLIVYALRYVFNPSGWLKALESTIAWSIWIIVALHLSGFLGQITQALEEIEFSIGKTPVNLLLIIQGLLTVVVTILIALWFSQLLENKLMRAEQVSLNMRVIATKLIRIFLVFIAVLMALSAVGLDITLLSVFGGALGVGLGFGLQKIASNYVSGFIILLDKSMEIGDKVSIDKHYGVIAEMRSRYTVLNKQDGTSVIIPNETLITSAVINHSLNNHQVSLTLQLAVKYESPLDKVMALMLEASTKEALVLKEPAPTVLIKGFNEQGVELSLVIWLADVEQTSATIQSRIYLEIWHMFNQNGIQFVKMENK